MCTVLSTTTSGSIGVNPVTLFKSQQGGPVGGLRVRVSSYLTLNIYHQIYIRLVTFWKIHFYSKCVKRYISLSLQINQIFSILYAKGQGPVRGKNGLTPKMTHIEFIL